MDKIASYLVPVADHMDSIGKPECANAIDNLIKTASMQKVAQYVGIIGYVLKQTRAIANCQRRKQAENKDRSKQELVMECLKEYQDSQDYHHTDWTEKYASFIQNNVDSFDDSHLNWINSIKVANNITEHVKMIKEAQLILNKNDIKDNMIEDLVSCMNSLNGVLSSEGQPENFFKVAGRWLDRLRNTDAPLSGKASPKKWWHNFTPSKQERPQSQRSRWSRLFSPMIGRNNQDEDTIYEMQKIKQILGKINFLTQTARTDISRLKNESNISLSQEQNEVVQQINSMINSLSDNNWAKTINDLKNIEKYYKEVVGATPELKQLFEKTQLLSNDLSENINDIYENVQQLQVQMNYLRNREPVMGRGDSTINPMEDFLKLEQILQNLYANPFDSQALLNAEKMHNSLWNKLRRIQAEPNPAADESGAAAPTAVGGGTPAGATHGGSAATTEEPRPARTVMPEIRTEVMEKAIAHAGLSLDEAEQVFQNMSIVMPEEPYGPVFERIIETIENMKRKSTSPATPGGSPITGPPGHSEINPDDHSDLLKRKFDDTFEMSASNVTNMIKLSDSLDRIDPQLSDLLDKFLEDNVNKIIKNKENFAEIPVLIKEPIQNYRK